MREYTETSIKLDPANHVNSDDYAICFDKLYEVAMRAGDLKAAEQACIKSIELRKALVARDLSNPRFAKELHQDESRLAGVYGRMKAAADK